MGEKLINIIILLFIIGILGINTFFWASKPRLQAVWGAALKNNSEPAYHLYLAELYWQNQNLPAAEKEIGLFNRASYSHFIKSASPSSPVLGVQTSAADNFISNLQNFQVDIKAKSQKWQEISAQYPDYLDAHLMLSVLAMSAGDFAKAEKNLQTASRLDPDNHKLAELRLYLGQLQTQ